MGVTTTSSQAGDFRSAALQTGPHHYSRVAGTFNARATSSESAVRLEFDQLLRQRRQPIEKSIGELVGNVDTLTFDITKVPQAIEKPARRGRANHGCRGRAGQIPHERASGLGKHRRRRRAEK